MSLTPRQIAGLVRMYACDAEECRSWPDPCCYRLVFYGEIIAGVPTSTSTYENDVNSFVVEMSLYAANSNATLTWTLEKCVNVRTCEWDSVATLNNNNYGTYYALGSIVNHSKYGKYEVNWGKVLKLQGVGMYRIKATTNLGSRSGCLVSEPIEVRAWDCERAHGTVKFESRLSGMIGDFYNKPKMFDLCGMNHHDSIRVSGMFGNESSEYQTERDEYPNGLVQQTRDEQVQIYTFQSGLWPKWVHDRLKTYGLMAYQTLVSDYNINNSDYEIRQMLIVKDGAHSPEYFDKDWLRRSDVNLTFKAGYQSLVTSQCCNTELPHG